MIVLDSPRIQSLTPHKIVSASGFASAPRSFFPLSKASSNVQSYPHAMNETNSNSLSSLKSLCSDSIDEKVEEGRERKLTVTPSPKDGLFEGVALGGKNGSDSPKARFEEQNLKRIIIKGDSLTIIRQMRAAEKRRIEESKALIAKTSKKATKGIKKRSNCMFRIALEKLSFDPLYNY
jgi:hypothetical protein